MIVGIDTEKLHMQADSDGKLVITLPTLTDAIVNRRVIIPVSFIEKIMKLAEEVGAKEYAEHLEVLLNDWEEEIENESKDFD